MKTLFVLYNIVFVKVYDPKGTTFNDVITMKIYEIIYVLPSNEVLALCQF